MGHPRLVPVQDSSEQASAGGAGVVVGGTVEPNGHGLAAEVTGWPQQLGRPRADIHGGAASNTHLRRASPARRAHATHDTHRRCAASPPRLRGKGHGGGHARLRCRTTASGRPRDGAAVVVGGTAGPDGHMRMSAEAAARWRQARASPPWPCRRGDGASAAVGVVRQPRASICGGAAAQRSIRGAAALLGGGDVGLRGAGGEGEEAPRGGRGGGDGRRGGEGGATAGKERSWLGGATVGGRG
nr:hypothetical protein fge_4_PS127F06_c1_12849 [Paspalum simplex]